MARDFLVKQCFLVFFREHAKIQIEKEDEVLICIRRNYTLRLISEDVEFMSLSLLVPVSK